MPTLHSHSHSARARYELACAQLRAGNYLDGFRNYESRWEAADLPRPVHTDRPLLGDEWRGQDLKGKRILLHAEQGFGDTIQFLRYAPLVCVLGAQVVVEVQPALRELAACMAPACSVGTGVPVGTYDFHSSLIDLPVAFRTTMDTLPAPVTLTIPDAVVQFWSRRIPATKRKKLGLVWAGNPKSSIDGKRSLRLDTLKPVLDHFADAELFSFQVGPTAAQLNRLGGQLIDLQPELRTFVDTAAALLRMDIVITVDTAVAHLAGSLGLDVWLLLSHIPCWRWLLDTSRSPWYPSMRLFRQPSEGDWDTVIRNVALSI